MFIFASILLIFKTISGLRSAGGGRAKEEDDDSVDESSVTSARSVRSKHAPSDGEDGGSFSLQGSEDDDDASSEFSLPKMKGLTLSGTSFSEMGN